MQVFFQNLVKLEQQGVGVVHQDGRSAVKLMSVGLSHYQGTEMSRDVSHMMIEIKLVLSSDSAVTRHLKLSPKRFIVCVVMFTIKHCKIVARARSTCQLDVLEAIYISRKQPELCIQKEYVRKLYLF